MNTNDQTTPSTTTEGTTMKTKLTQLRERKATWWWFTIIAPLVTLSIMLATSIATRRTRPTRTRSFRTGIAVGGLFVAGAIGLAACGAATPDDHVAGSAKPQAPAADTSRQDTIDVKWNNTAQDGLSVGFNAMLTKPSKGATKITKYTWNFGDGSKDVNTTEYVVTHKFPKPGSYQVRLTTADDKSKTGYLQRQLKVTGNQPQTAVDAKKLDDPGPGNCLPGPQILQQLRTTKPGGEDYVAPYTATELLTLTNAEVSWIQDNTAKPCVQALAASFNVPVDQLGDYYSTKLQLKPVGADGLVVQNSYFDHTSGAIIWWRVQQLRAGELVWFDKNGAPVDLYACGNRVRVVTSFPPVPNVPPTPVTYTPPTAPPGTVCTLPPYAGQPGYVQVGKCEVVKPPQSKDCQQNGGYPGGNTCPANPSHQEVGTDRGNQGASKGQDGNVSSKPVTAPVTASGSTENSGGYDTGSSDTGSAPAGGTTDSGGTTTGSSQPDTPPVCDPSLGCGQDQGGAGSPPVTNPG